MADAKAAFSAEARERIRNSVMKAESRTSAEIMPVVAESSGRYDRAEDMVGLWFGVLAMVGTWFAFRGVDYQPGDWSFQWASLELPALIAASVVGFLIGAILGGSINWLRAMFVPRGQMADEVAARARGMFFDNRVHHTAGQTGLLVYVSRFERRAAVLADQNVTEKLGQEKLNALCGKLTEELKTTDIVSALCTTIESAGDQLADVLPREEGDVNELEDVLVYIEAL